MSHPPHVWDFPSKPREGISDFGEGLARPNQSKAKSPRMSPEADTFRKPPSFDADVKFKGSVRNQDTGFQSAETLPLGAHRHSMRDQFAWSQTPIATTVCPPRGSQSWVSESDRTASAGAPFSGGLPPPSYHKLIGNGAFRAPIPQRLLKTPDRVDRTVVTSTVQQGQPTAESAIRALRDPSPPRRRSPPRYPSPPRRRSPPRYPSPPRRSSPPRDPSPRRQRSPPRDYGPPRTNGPSRPHSPLELHRMRRPDVQPMPVSLRTPVRQSRPPSEPRLHSPRRDYQQSRPPSLPKSHSPPRDYRPSTMNGSSKPTSPLRPVSPPKRTIPNPARSSWDCNREPYRPPDRSPHRDFSSERPNPYRVESTHYYPPRDYDNNSYRRDGNGSHGTRPWKAKFSGAGKTSLKLFLRQFNLFADFNAWSDTEKALQLVASLEGQALDTLDRVQGSLSYDRVVDALRVRYPDYDCASGYQNAFDTAFRKQGEDASSFANRLGDMAYKAYPEVPSGSMASMILRRFIMAQPKSLKGQINLVNPSNIKEAVQLVNRLDGHELEKLQEVTPTATHRPLATYPTQSMVDALHGLRVECESDSSESGPDIAEDPAELIAALANIGATDISEMLAANAAQATPTTPFKCFFCKDTGHTWLRCTKLWDHLKKNGFKANPKGGKPYKKHRSKYASKGDKPASAGIPQTPKPPVN